MREVRGLRWVRALAKRPACVPIGRPRGAKREGVRFENAVAEGLSGAEHGAWFEYEDAVGHGFAQMDFVWRGAGAAAGASPWVIVGEAKLTWRREAYAQLRRLYWPLVQGLWPGASVGGVVICRNVTRETPKADVVGSLPEALDLAEGGRVIPVLHLPLVIGVWPPKRRPAGIVLGGQGPAERSSVNNGVW